MKNVLTIALIFSSISCTPSQRLFFFHPAALGKVIKDTCDVYMIKHLKPILDTTDYWTYEDPAVLLDKIDMKDTCNCSLKKIYHPKEEQKDSSVWLLTIKPYQMKRKEIIIGNLYTLHQDSIFILERRFKPYSQEIEFEGGSYIRLTYYIENDTTTIVRMGSMKY